MAMHARFWVGATRLPVRRRLILPEDGLSDSNGTIMLKSPEGTPGARAGISQGLRGAPMNSSFRYYARPARWGAFAAALTALMAVLCLSSLWNPVFCDFNVWLRIARDVAAGKTLYVDSYDNHQPPQILLCEFLFLAGGNPALGGYVVHVVLGAMAGLLLYLALASTGGVRAPWLAPVLILCWSACSDAWTRGWCSEAFSIHFDVMTVALLFLAVARGRAALAFLAGACYFWVVGLRVPCAVHGAAYLPILWLAWRKRGAASALRLLLAFALGLGLMVGLVCWHAVAHGYWAAWFQVLETDKKYGALSNVPLTESLRRFAAQIGSFAWSRDLPAFALAVGGGALLAARWRKLGRAARAWSVVAGCWLAMACVGVMPGGRHFKHYYEALWPPMLLLGGLWPTVFGGGRGAARLGRRLAWGVLVGSVAVCLAERAVTYRNYRARMANGTHDSIAIAKMTREIDARVSPNDAMIDWLWDDWTELLWRARRPSGGRLPDLSLGLRAAVHKPIADADVRRLLANTPRWVVMNGDFADQTDGQSGADVEALKRRIREQFDVVATAGPLRLLHRRETTPSPAGAIEKPAPATLGAKKPGPPQANAAR
jgi:hypothetical protein